MRSGETADSGRHTTSTPGSRSVEGNFNTAFNMGSVGRDVRVEQHVHYSYRQNAAAVAQGQFFPVALEDFGPKRWVEPPQAPELVQLLEEHRLLVLAGELDEKKDCAYHLIHELRERLRPKHASEIQVLEKCSGRDPQKIEMALDGEESKILLLPDVSPLQIVGQTPATLRVLLRTQRSYAILTTDNNRKEWGIDSGSLEAKLWRELSWESYYGVPLLGEFLRKQLRDSKKQVPELLLPRDPKDLTEGLALSKVAATLRTPGNVRFFCEWLLEVGEHLTRNKVEDQLARLGHDDRSVGQWYRQFDSRQQLLVLGLTLFDGLPDDLIFAGLELLVERIWRSSDPSIPQFDYGDLVHCAAHFKKLETQRGSTRICCSSQERRQQILGLAWDQQRRRLLAALPVLREMIQISAASAPDSTQERSEPAPAQPGSVKRPAGKDQAVREPVAQEGTVQRPAAAAPPPTQQRGAAERALNRSEEDTLQLHQALVDALGLISRLSPQVVERHFLELAADSEESVQRLAARALSIWRDDGHEKELLALLDRWWREACEPWDLDSRIARLGSRDNDPFVAVRAAVALAIGYAGRFDRPNQLDNSLYDLLVRVLEDRHPRVRRAAARALQLAVAWHFRQLEPLLRMKVLHSDAFLHAVARGAAEACALRTEETVAILDNWRAVARAEKRRSSPYRITPRERLLATVALTYGEINGGEGALGPQILCANLRSILMEELHPYVRQAAFAAIEKQALWNFDSVVQLLQDLLSQIQLQDRPAVVKIFTKTYLHQRQRLTGGDHKVEIEGRSYDVWMESARPLTEIEATLYGWLLDSSHPIVQQLAVDVFDELGRTRLEVVERERRAMRPLIPGNAAPAGGFDGRPQPQVRKLPLLGYAAVYAVAPRKPPVRSTLQPLLAEMIALPKSRASAEEALRLPAEVLVERWGAVPNQAAKAVARLLGRAFSLYRYRYLIISLAILIGAGIYMGAPIAVHRIQDALARSRAQAETPAEPSVIPAQESSPSPPAVEGTTP